MSIAKIASDFLTPEKMPIYCITGVAEANPIRVKGKPMKKFIVSDATECIGCHACEIACVVAHNQENWPQDRGDFLPRLHVVAKGKSASVVVCHHCTHAPCVASCPVDALTYQYGCVQLDERRCIGCKNCAIACPFGVIEMAENGAQKCDLCEQRVAGGPACVQACPTQAIRLMDGHGIEQLQKRRRHQVVSGMSSHAKVSSCRSAFLKTPARKGAEKRQQNNEKHILMKFIKG